VEINSYKEVILETVKTSMVIKKDSVDLRKKLKLSWQEAIDLGLNIALQIEISKTKERMSELNDLDMDIELSEISKI
jgi:hypothetical protein